MRRALALAALLAASAGAAAQTGGGGAAAALAGIGGEPDLLPPEQAFRFEVLPRGRSVRINARIAEGYYLYRKRLDAATGTPGAVLGELLKPTGKPKDDPLFGRVQVFRDRVSIDVPVERMPADGSTLEVAVTSQGCADLGVCFPPDTRSFTVALDSLSTGGAGTYAASAGNPVAGGGGALSRIARAFGSGTSSGGESDFLPVDQAFAPSARVTADGQVEVAFQIAEGYYLYRQRLGFAAASPASARLGKAALPDGKRKHDQYFGEQEVYYQQLAARVPVSGAAAGAALEMTVSYQGCADAGLCYPPQERLLSVVMPAGGGGAGIANPASSLSETDQLAQALISDSLPWVLATFFAAGLLLAFTPCVLPMIPILSAIIAGQEGEPSGRRGFALSLVYVLAMSLTYTLAGVAAALFGQNLQALFQHPAVLVGFSVLFLVLSLAMFGVYELQLPVSLQSRLATISHGQRGGSYTGVGVMGVLSALIVGPCVAAPLAAALIVIGSTGDPTRGGLALFALSLGMGMPLLAVGAFGPRLLPRAGPWMTLVKYVFGIMLLAVAVYLLSRLLPDPVSVALWAVLALVSATLLAVFARRNPGPDHHALRRVCTGTAGAAMLYGVVLAVGAATGARDPLSPLQGLDGSHGEELRFQRVKTVAELERLIAGAQAAGRPVMLDFYADWCVSCKQMERETFTDPAVHAALEGALLLQADVTVYDEADKALLARFGLFGPPAILFFGADGLERREFRVIGYMTAADFRPHVTRAQG